MTDIQAMTGGVAKGKPKKLCIVCHERPPTVPDRNSMGKPTKKVCSECHAERLRQDVVRIINSERAKNAKRQNHD